jgi:hypothetical protein
MMSDDRKYVGVSGRAIPTTISKPYSVTLNLGDIVSGEKWPVVVDYIKKLPNQSPDIAISLPSQPPGDKKEIRFRAASLMTDSDPNADDKDLVKQKVISYIKNFKPPIEIEEDRTYVSSDWKQQA